MTSLGHRKTLKQELDQFNKPKKKFKIDIQHQA